MFAWYGFTTKAVLINIRTHQCLRLVESIKCSLQFDSTTERSSYVTLPHSSNRAKPYLGAQLSLNNGAPSGITKSLQ